MSSMTKLTFLMLIVVSIGSTTYAFAAANTARAGNAGDGTGKVSGFQVSDVAYRLGADPSRVDSISFTLDSPARLVRIQLAGTSPDWYNCIPAGAADWTCETPGASLAAIDGLRVVAAGN